MENITNKSMDSWISYLEGSLITFDEATKTVFWFSQKNKKYSVATLEKGADWFIGELDSNDYHLENVKDFDDIDAAMLTYLKRKGIKLDIEIDFSEEDIEDLKSGESFNWTYTDIKYESLEINVRIYNSEYQ
jgi:hypothetical protein